VDIEFHRNRQCRCTQAEKEDGLSLLRGMSEQEISRQNNKGIFTVRQLSYTFRVRRRNKRAKRQAFPRSYALQALAIRENKIHVHGSYAVPSSPTSIYLDIEGLPATGSGNSGSSTATRTIRSVCSACRGSVVIP
jgi:predicted RecB family nuclease